MKMNLVTSKALKRIVFTASVFLCIALNGCGASWHFEVWNPANSQEQTLKAADLAHKKLVINFWAEWCKPCREEIPQLNAFATAHRDSVVVLALNFDHPHDHALQTAAQKAGITYPSLITDPATLWKLPDIEGLPTTLILDDHGKVLKVLTGPQTQQSLDAALAL